MYTHPVFDRGKRTSMHTGVFDLGKEDFVTQQGSTEGYDEISTDIDAYLTKLHNAEALRKRLGIPRFIYHAVGFSHVGYDISHVRNIVEWVRGHGLELRVWVSEQSALLLLVVADPDLSEDSGWALYDYVQQHAPSYDSYGLPSWFEFCMFGTPVPADWPLIERKGHLLASSPDGQQVVMFGG